MNTSDDLFFHKSVLVDQVLDYLDPRPGGVYLDVTFGSGGHTRAILEKEPACRVIAMDWDERSLEIYGVPLQEEFGERLRLVWGNFALLYKIIKKENILHLDGILADFGTSQMQIFDRPGFSVYRDTPLDMRMAPGYQSVTAEHVVNRSSEEKLREILWQLGQESKAKEIARLIVHERQKKRIRTTKQLANLIAQVKSSVKKRIHPATKTFQALRLYVNKELNNIAAFLPIALELLNPGGRLVCISFHSLEDRLVKQFFKEKEKEGAARLLTSHVITASDEERALNPSARSAKLRALERL